MSTSISGRITAADHQNSPHSHSPPHTFLLPSHLHQQSFDLPFVQKRTADEAVVDEKPVSKKSKPSSTVAPAKPKSTTKPKSTGNGNGVTTEPAAKPASKATKPKSTASKPASKSAKPASAAKPKSATATKNKKNEEKEAIEEEKDAEASAEEKPTTGGAKELGLGDKLPKIVLP